jgi:Zn-dependent protease with chaperone function
VAAAQLVLALAAGALAGIPLVLVALVVAPAFSSARVRCRVYTAAFVASAALVPLALATTLAPVRPAGLVAVASFERLVAAYAPEAILAGVGLVALVLTGDLLRDLTTLMRVKARSRVDRAEALGARRAPLAISASLRAPTAIGYFHPRIVVPQGFRTRVSGKEWRAILAHENAHLRRYDDWWKAAQTVVVRVFWFLPALWVLAARLDLERELASDELVVASTGRPRAYAACLVRLVVDTAGPRSAPAAWRSRAQVAVRVERILRPRPAASAGRAAMYVGALSLSLVTSGLLTALLAPPASMPSAHTRVARHRATPTKPRSLALFRVPSLRGECRTCAYLHSPMEARLDGGVLFGDFAGGLSEVPAAAAGALPTFPGNAPKGHRPSWGWLLY